jgi:hypothetical protein
VLPAHAGAHTIDANDMSRSLRNSAALAASVAFAAIALSPGASVLAAASLRVVPAHPTPVGGGKLGSTARRALRQGYLVPNQRAYERAKAAAARRLARARALAVPPPLGPAARRLAPQIGRSWTGGATDNFAPSDSTGAVGTSRFVQLVNSAFSVYDKGASAPLATGPLSTLAGADPGDSLFDVQVIWDPTTKRFYYTMIDMANKSHNNLAFGFSKGSSPNGGSNSDWCKYKIGFGAQFPDFPKLGDSKSFALIGLNVFVGSAFAGAEVLAVHKPPSGSGCPGSPKLDTSAVLKTNSSTPAFSPVPANEIDTRGSGWVVARPTQTPSTKLAVFKVTKDSKSGKARIQRTSTNISVDKYAIPPAAPQAGTGATLDTLDARFTQAVGAIDPNRDDKFALWTQHTIAGGAGSRVRWYEIDPSKPKLLQKDSASSSSLYEFNGAISPNRQVSGSTAKGGANMLMNFSSSSAASFPEIGIVSKKGGKSQSPQALVLASPGPLGGFDCTMPEDDATCRWGDYASATPDPKDKSKIWNVNQWASGELPACTPLYCPATWRSQNFIASP